MRRIMRKHLLVTAIIAAFLTGCISKPCTPGHLAAGFIGFSPTELDTVIYRSYEANGAFNKLIDTELVTRKTWDYQSSGDTTVLETSWITRETSNEPLRPGYDWQVYIPAAKKTVSISKIMFEQTEKTAIFLNDIWGCIAPLTSYNQDGQLMMAKSSSFGQSANGYNTFFGDILFIQK
jgi:hypothetical protein